MIFCQCFSLHRELSTFALMAEAASSDLEEGCGHLKLCYLGVGLLCRGDRTVGFVLQLVIFLPSLILEQPR